MDRIGRQIYQTNRKLVHLLTHQFKPYDITPEQWNILRRLEERDGIKQKELATAAGKDQTTITRILDNLEKKQAVRKAVKAGDRRSYLIYLTEEGRRILRLLQPVFEETMDKVLSGIPGERLAAFQETLDQLQAKADEELAKSMQADLDSL
ncbi:transcriptional regulator [Paenibacillus sp. J31TS4]|uniref:MarR family winged helix-turn-helix transcriptional regulator n=1 Tax=Paenibacillus sp. J31TS4 TaxID=2807195 RepID=UPI001B047EA0|nr:MarR family transcriptional regulator [Paenibacillus sp. J31TS4]GIP40852.1 transcriptional regulator [Paenibacillus sp. J31TS4]